MGRSVRFYQQKEIKKQNKTPSIKTCRNKKNEINNKNNPIETSDVYSKFCLKNNNYNNNNNTNNNNYNNTDNYNNLETPNKKYNNKKYDKISLNEEEDKAKKIGVVVKYSYRKHYGFIRPHEENGVQNPDVFVHHTSVIKTNDRHTLKVGQIVEYTVAYDERTAGKHAINVMVLGYQPSSKSNNYRSTPYSKYQTPPRSNNRPRPRSLSSQYDNTLSSSHSVHHHHDHEQLSPQSSSNDDQQSSSPPSSPPSSSNGQLSPQPQPSSNYQSSPQSTNSHNNRLSDSHNDRSSNSQHLDHHVTSPQSSRSYHSKHQSPCSTDTYYSNYYNNNYNNHNKNNSINNNIYCNDFGSSSNIPYRPTTPQSSLYNTKDHHSTSSYSYTCDQDDEDIKICCNLFDNDYTISNKEFTYHINDIDPYIYGSISFKNGISSY